KLFGGHFRFDGDRKSLTWSQASGLQIYEEEAEDAVFVIALLVVEHAGVFPLRDQGLLLRLRSAIKQKTRRVTQRRSIGCSDEQLGHVVKAHQASRKRRRIAIFALQQHEAAYRE